MLRNRTQSPPSLPSAQYDGLELQSRIKRRDPLAMGELYDRYGKLAFTVIQRIVRDKVVAEDLLAETFVKVWNQVARWRDARIEDLHLWLLLLARQHALEHLRSRNEPLPRALPRISALTQPAVLQDFPRPRNEDEWKRLLHGFAALTEKETRILEMSSFDGMPPNEIALNLGETLIAVKEAIRSACAKLSATGRE
jgi:RNA polymerase sigma-70 factor (ECF subfamily)